MSRENFQYDGLLGLTFIDEDGNEMPAADAMNLEKAQSFGGNRSEAGRHAAQARWGARQAESGSTSSTHGLITESPVHVMSNGELAVEQENGGLRAPTAAERGVPVGKDFKDSVQADMDSLKEASPTVHKEVLTSFVNPAKVNGDKAHELYNVVGTYRKPNALGSDFASARVTNITNKADTLGWKYGSQGQWGKDFPQIASIVDRIQGAMVEFASKFSVLETKPMA